MPKEDVKVPAAFIKNTLSAWLTEALLDELERRGLDDIRELVIAHAWCDCVDRYPRALQDAEHMVPEALRALERVGRRS